MLEALDGLPESERAKYLDVTGQCHVVGGTNPGSLAPAWIEHGCRAQCLCMWGATRGSSAVQSTWLPGPGQGVTVPGWTRRGGSFSRCHVFNTWVSPAAASCAFKLAYIFYSQNLHEEASSVCQLFCKRLQTADAYACPEIPPERVSACLMLLAETGLN